MFLKAATRSVIILKPEMFLSGQLSKFLKKNNFEDFFLC